MCANLNIILNPMDIPERRESRRLKANLPVTFERLGSLKQFGDSSTKDISTTGLRMNMEGFSAPTSTFLIKLHFPEVNRILEGSAKIVWSHRISYSDQYQAGLHFTELNPTYKKWLEEYIVINETLAK